jgi:hypothetical protein
VEIVPNNKNAKFYASLIMWLEGHALQSKHQQQLQQ